MHARCAGLGVAAAGFALVAGIGPAAAEPTSPPDGPPPPAYIQAQPKAIRKSFGPEIANFIFSDQLTPIRLSAVFRSAKSIPGFACPPEPEVVLIDIIPYPVRPGAISWIEGYLLTCAPRHKRSFLLLLDGTRTRIAELLPGYTLADPLLQRDAVLSAQGSTNALRPQGCDHSSVIDTNISAAPEDRNSPWLERWTFDLCGTRADVDMTFTPSTRGGTTWVAKLVQR